MEQEKGLEIRKDKIKEWLKNPNNLALLTILIFAFFIRLNFFLATTEQPLWWDEAAYGTLAMNHIYGVWTGESLLVGETLIRPPLMPLLWSYLIQFGIGETGVRFILQFLPSFFSVFFVYLVGTKLYDKKVGLISAAIFSGLWIHLFYSSRLLTNVPALAFLLASIYFFVESTEKGFKAKPFAISIFLLSLSTLIRYPNGIVFFAYLFFLAIIFRTGLIKNKSFYIAGIIGISPLLIFFGYNYSTQGNIFPAFLGGDYLNSGEISARPIGYYVLNFIPTYLKTSFFVFFILGLVLAVLELLIGYDLIRKKRNLKGHLLNLLVFTTVLSFFVFYARGAEDRYLIPIAPSMALFSAIGIYNAAKFLKTFHKHLPALFVLGILIFGGYQQYQYADQLINERKSSFLHMRQGFEWIAANTPEDSIIIGSGITAYSIYYAPPREVYDLPYKDLPEIEGIEKLIEDLNGDYLVIHIFTAPEPYTNEYLSRNQDKWEPVQAYFMDSAKTQPSLIIYKRIN